MFTYKIYVYYIIVLPEIKLELTMNDERSVILVHSRIETSHIDTGQSRLANTNNFYFILYSINKI